MATSWTAPARFFHWLIAALILLQVGLGLAAVGWLQSHIPDAAQRELLFDLSITRTRLAEAGLAREELLRLDKSVSNLLRMWAR